MQSPIKRVVFIVKGWGDGIINLKHKKMMYFVIESSPIGSNVVGNFSTKIEAERKIDSLIPIGECVCDYYVTKIEA